MDLSKAYLGKSQQRPSDEVNPELKQSDPQWSLDWCEFIYSQHINDQCAITQADAQRFKINRAYSAGKQDTNLYKSLILDEDLKSDQPNIASVDSDGKIKQNYRKGYVNVDFDTVFSPLPKIVQSIIGIMENNDHNVFAQAIDEGSITLKETNKYKALVRGTFADYFNKLNSLMGVNHQEQGVLPKSVKELQLLETLGAFKLDYESGLDKSIDHTFKASNEKLIKRRNIKDLLNCGICATEDYFDENLGEVRVRYVDPINLIIESSKEPDFSDSSYYGFIDYPTMFQIKHETGLTDQELYELAGNYRGEYGNSNEVRYELGSDGLYDFLKFRVPVLRSKWRSNDYEYRTKRETQSGEVADFPEPYRGKAIPKIHNKENRSTYQISTKSLYQATWIIGSEVVYGYGKVHGISYDYRKKDVKLGIHVYKIEEKPIMEACIPVEDQIFLTHLRLQNAIAKSPPPGLGVEYNSLMGMAIENEDWSPLDVLRMYSQTGNLIFSVSPNGIEIPPNYPDPVRELKGGLGTSIEDAIKSFQLAFDNLRVVTGIDELTLSTASPTQQQGLGVSQIAIASTNNTLKPIYSGWISIKESIALSIALMVQALVTTGTESVYTNIIGESSIAALKASGNQSPVQLGVHLIAAPDDALKQEVRATAQAALAGGKNGIPALTYSEYLFVIDSLNSTMGISSARLYIAMREAEREQKDREFAMQSMQKQSEEVQAQNQAKAQAEMQKLAAEKDKALTEINAKGDFDLKLEQLKHQNKMAEIQLEASLAPKPVASVK